MSTQLSIGIEQLLSGIVEPIRLELKASWDEKTTGPQIIKTLCAFANDLQNLNGGYIILGVEEQNGAAIRPVKGIPVDLLDTVQKWIRGQCQRIDPIYQPVFEVAQVDGKHILILWAPASDVKPHQAPDGAKGERKYWVRIGSETQVPKGEILTRLMQQTARVPFDDRRALGAKVTDIKYVLVKEYLSDVGSDLIHQTNENQIYTNMNIITPQNGHSLPKNIGLLFFNESPTTWFPGAKIELVQFHDDAGGNVSDERTFSGPLHHQLRQCLNWLSNLTFHHKEKQEDDVTTKGWLNYPMPALREALVNAVYHRSYEGIAEPTKVYLYPDRIEIISYPGPIDGIELDHLNNKRSFPPIPNRNRRIGEFLKNLSLAEGYRTGFPKIFRSMKNNGSPKPEFDFDQNRSYFRVTLKAHPEYIAITALKEYAYKKITGTEADAIAFLKETFEQHPSASIAKELIDYNLKNKNFEHAIHTAKQVKVITPFHMETTLSLVQTLIDEKMFDETDAFLKILHSLLDNENSAIEKLYAGKSEQAHALFNEAGNLLNTSPEGIYAFAACKIQLANNIRKDDLKTAERLYQEALPLLERVVQLDTSPELRGDAWFNLGRLRQKLGNPKTDIISAFEKALALQPNDPKFQEALAEVKKSIQEENPSTPDNH